MTGRLAAAGILLALLGAWELYCAVADVDPIILPAPHEVAQTMWDDRSGLASDLWVTFREVVLGIVLAVVAGAVCAALVHRSPVLRRAVYPLLLASQTVPIPLVAPLLIVWFGFGLAPKLVIVALICFFPVVVTTLDALASTDREQLKMIRTLGATRRQAFWRVEAPAALPGLFSGARIAVTVALIGAVLAEQAGAEEGLGRGILLSLGQLDTADAYAAVVLLSLVAVVLYAAVGLLQRILIPWSLR